MNRSPPLVRTVILECRVCLEAFSIDVWPGCPQGVPPCPECGGDIEDGFSCDHLSGVYERLEPDPAARTG